MDSTFQKYERAEFRRRSTVKKEDTATLTKTGMLYFGKEFTDKYQIGEKDYACVYYAKLTKTLAIELVDKTEEYAIKFYPITSNSRDIKNNTSINLSGIQKAFGLLRSTQSRRSFDADIDNNLILIHGIK